MAAGVEFSDLDWLTILLGIVANMGIGFLWYSPKTPTGKVWMAANKIPATAKPTSGQMMLGLTLMIVGAFFMMFVFQHVNVAFRDAYRIDGARLGEGGLTYGDGAFGALSMWLGFVVPIVVGSVAWEGKPWKLFWVNALYYFVVLMIAGLLFAWRL